MVFGQCFTIPVYDSKQCVNSVLWFVDIQPNDTNDDDNFSDVGLEEIS